MKQRNILASLKIGEGDLTGGLALLPATDDGSGRSSRSSTSIPLGSATEVDTLAVALNTQFVPKSQYASQALHEGDRLEVISPVTGG